MSFTIKDKKQFRKTTAVVFAAFVIYEVAGIIIHSFSSLDEIPSYLVSEFFLLIPAIIAAVIMKKQWAMKPTGKGFGRGLLVGWWFVFYGLFGMLLASAVKDLTVTVPGSYVVMLLVFSLLIGISEELLCRGVLLNGYLDTFGEETPASIRTAVIAAGVLFGLLHLVNVFKGMGFTSALVQSCVNMPAGILLGAVYVRSRKNLLPGIVVHAFMDFCGFVASGVLAGGALVSDSRYSVFHLVFGLIELALALFALRTKKLQKLIDEGK